MRASQPGVALMLLLAVISLSERVPAAEAPVPQTAGPAATQPSAVEEREVARLVKQLNDDSFEVRDAAVRKLLTLGGHWYGFLRQAQQDAQEAEVRQQLAVVLAQLWLWDGKGTVGEYARRMGIKETERTVDLTPAGAVEPGGKVTLKLTLIPAGEFLMGSPATENAGKGDQQDESQYLVTLTRPFWMGVHEVTVGQFAAFVKDSGYKTEAESDGKGAYGREAREWKQDPKFTWKNTGFTQGDDHPVVNLSWTDAEAFCKWLSRKEGKKYRLPTEAEWEYACRAGSTTAYHAGDKEADLGEAGWYVKNSEGKTHAVGGKKANPWGLYDMHGNVWEWCGDWYGPYPAGAVSDPTGPGTGTFRVQRGGGWGHLPAYCRSAARFKTVPEYRHTFIGFRVVLDLSE